MAQQVIDGVLYSPVNAHALRKGDLIVNANDGESYRLNANPAHRLDDSGLPWLRVETTDLLGYDTWLKLWVNEPILRAVGAGVGGLL